MRKCVVAVVLAIAGAAVGQAQDRPWSTPRTEWDAPDLTGVWRIDNSARAPFQRVPADADNATVIAELVESGVFERARRDVPSVAAYQQKALAEWRQSRQNNTSLVVEPPDGRMPPLVEEGRDHAARAWKTTWNSSGPWSAAQDFGPDERCISRGLLGTMFPSSDHGVIEITQSPGLVAIRVDAIHEVRLVPTDGSGHLSAAITSYMGDSRGEWADGTLVIDTTNVNGRTGARAWGSELPLSSRLHVVERLTRVAADELRYEMTIEDPGTWTRPWTVRYSLEPAGEEIAEYACHENNAAFVRTALTASRGQDR